MRTTDLDRSELPGRILAGWEANKIGGASFALWGLLHVIVGGIGLGIYFTGGTGPLLEFVDIEAASNPQSERMAALVAEFYQALLLVGLSVLIVGVTLNWRGKPLGWGINTILVASIEVFFVWFEVIPGHRPVGIAVVTVALLAVGVVFCGLGALR